MSARRWVSSLVGLGCVIAVASGCHSGVPGAEAESAQPRPSVAVSTAAAEPSTTPCPEPGPASEAVRVTGKLFAEPQVAFKTPLTVDRVEASSPIVSTGDKVAAGDVVHVAYAVYHGRTGKLVETTNHGVQELVPLHVGTGLLPGLRGALACAGTQSRVVVVIPSDQAYGDEGSRSLGVPGGVPVVFVVDVDSVTRKADLPTE